MQRQDELKSREIEILRLMAGGLSNREIAERLYIGVETVRYYAKQIYSKLNVSGREEAAEKAQTLGLLDEEQQSTEFAQAKPKHSLPTQLTSFIGREKQIAEIIDLLSETRLLTLTGPGGTGKTRLSLKVAEQILSSPQAIPKTLGRGFSDGVYFVDLAPISNSQQIPKAIAATLNILEYSEEKLSEIIKRAIGERKILLVIDNFEHVIEGAEIVSDLLISTAKLKIMVTSREALRLTGEQEYPVPTLNIEQAVSSEAIALFLQRAQRVRPSFQIDENNLDTIIGICQRVDGLPLAIELAAARCKLLTPQALLKRLESRLGSLTGGSRDAPQRQQTLEATIDWSYDLLDEGEKLLFARMAIFRGGRSLEAIEAICKDNLPMDILDGLASLVDKSMVRQIEDELGEPRFIMLETIQEYALQKLDDFGETKALQRRHAQYFMELSERAAPELRLAHQEWWYTKLEIEQNNLRAVMTWAISGEDAEIGLRIVAALRDYWQYQGFHNEGWHWIQRALEFVEDVPELIQAQLLYAASHFAYLHRNTQASRTYAIYALSIYKQVNDTRGIAWTLLMLSITQDDIEERISLQKQALEMMKNQNDLPGEAYAFCGLGLTYAAKKDYEQAQIFTSNVLGIIHQTGEKRREVLELDNLGIYAFEQGRIGKAHKMFFESLKLAQELDFTFAKLEILWHCTALFYELTELEVAISLYGAIKEQEKITGQQMYPIDVIKMAEMFIGLRSIVDTPQFAAAYERGRKMSLDETVGFALQELEK